MYKFIFHILFYICVLFYSSFVVYLRISTFKQHSCVRGPLRECRSIRSGASRLPYYCAPLVCVSIVIHLLAVWQHDKPKTKNQNETVRKIKDNNPMAKTFLAPLHNFCNPCKGRPLQILKNRARPRARERHREMSPTLDSCTNVAHEHKIRVLSENFKTSKMITQKNV